MSDKADEIERIVEEFAGEFDCKVEGIEGTKIKIVCELGPADIDLETGEVETDIVHLRAGLEKALEQGTATPNVPAKVETPQRLPTAKIGQAVESLTVEDVKKYFCPAAPDVDAYAFLEVCKAKNLNPFLREAYLVAFENKKTQEFETSIIVGKDTFVRNAEAHPDFDGFRAGPIVKDSDGNLLFDREGEFLAPGETLLGAWAEVSRKGVKTPFKATVSMKEYNRNNRQWNQMPATMIRKVALVHVLREAFAETFGGLYDSSEMEVDS